MMRWVSMHRASRFACAVFSIGLASLSACGADETQAPSAVCADGCVTPPPARCDGDTLTRYALAGRCADGACQYDEGREPCTWGCEADACLAVTDVCPDGCPAVGEPRCEGAVAVVPGAGVCDATTRGCLAGDERFDCASEGLACAVIESRAVCVADTSGSCTDGLRNGRETDVDCGGTCPPCADTEGCMGAEDCASRVCEDGVCAAPSCSDGVANGGESSTDCGGPCEPCESGLGCVADTDCASGVCGDDGCMPPACDDEVQNGAETDVDCGGVCLPCPDTFECTSAQDCASGVCLDGACAIATCSDGIQNQAESGVDCGGPCQRCALGADCNEPTDCASLACVDGTCGDPSCDDGAQNGTETGVDCGGACPLACSLGVTCAVDADCASRVCVAGACFRSCADGVQNGPETGLDCGGDCRACDVGEPCERRLDCLSLSCIDAVCAAPTCADGERNGAESGVDCGGGCEGCDVGERCLLDRDCADRTCFDGICVRATCDDGLANGDEPDVDCGGTCATPCAIGQGCARTDDCESGECVLGICRATCSDGVRNGAEWGIDCGGDCLGCAPGAPCGDARDCRSLLCLNTPDAATPCDGEDDVACRGGVCDLGLCAGQCSEATCDDGVRNQGELSADCGGPCPGAPCAVECEASTMVVDLNAAADGAGGFRIVDASARFPAGSGAFFPGTGQCIELDRGGGPEVVHRFVAPATGTYRFDTAPSEVADVLTVQSTVYVWDRVCRASADELGCGESALGGLGAVLELELVADAVYFVVVDSESSAAAGQRYALEVIPR